jgi:hypothetical protein
VDSPLEEDGFELSLGIRPEENCGFPGSRNRRNSTPSRGKIVSKKGVRSEPAVDSEPRSRYRTAYLLAHWVSLPNAVGLSEIPMQIPGVGWRGTRHKDP